MIDFQRYLRESYEGITLLEQGWASGLAACCFGFHPPYTYRIAEEYHNLRSSRGPHGVKSNVVRDGIEGALHSCIATIGEGLLDFEAELHELDEDGECLAESLVIDAAELSLSFPKGSRKLDDALASLLEQHLARCAELETRRAEIKLIIGF